MSNFDGGRSAGCQVPGVAIIISKRGPVNLYRDWFIMTPENFELLKLEVLLIGAILINLKIRRLLYIV